MKKVLIGCCAAFGILCILFLGFLFLVGVIVSSNKPNKPIAHNTDSVVPSPPIPAPVQTKTTPSGYDPALKAQRSEFIEKLQQQGVFGDIVVRNKVGRVIADSKFALCDFKQKQTFASVAYAWCLDQDIDCGMLVIHDKYTNEKIGTFSYGQLKLNNQGLNL